MIKYSIRFYPLEKGTARVTVRAGGVSVSMRTGVNIDVDKWDASTQRCTRGSYHGPNKIPATAINSELQRIEDDVRECLVGVQGTPDAETFRRDVTNAIRGNVRGRKGDIFALYDDFIAERGAENSWSRATVYKHRRIKEDLRDFNPQFSVKDLNAKTLEKFRAFLLSRALQNETVKKKITHFKWFARWLLERGLITDTTFLGYHPRMLSSSRPVVFFDWDELMTLYTRDLPPYLARVRDLVCFCSFTSLRFSDAVKLKKTDIYGGALHVTTQKTNTALTIELNKYSAAILNRYKALDGPLALPSISNQKANDYIKEACRICGLTAPVTFTRSTGTRRFTYTVEKWQVVSTHCGRRSFICNALMLGIPPTVVMQWTGHSDYKAMRPYIAVTDRAKANAMKAFDR